MCWLLQLLPTNDTCHLLTFLFYFANASQMVTPSLNGGREGHITPMTDFIKNDNRSE